jgi:hypothetical protein
VDGQVQRSMRDVRWQPPAMVRPDDALLLDLE